jgi:hypothetical protein
MYLGLLAHLRAVNQARFSTAAQLQQDLFETAIVYKSAVLDYNFPTVALIERDITAINR